MKQYKISDLISSPAKGQVKNISDYAFLTKILKLYRNQHFDYMSRCIRKYGDFIFFRDLVVYLEDIYSSGTLKKFYYEDIVNEYIGRLEFVMTKNL